MTAYDTVLSPAERILAQQSDPVVRVRLLRDVLHVPPASPEYVMARRAVESSQWVQSLEQEQHPDGSWGRLHSQDTHAGQKTPTTEYAVDRALALGLDADHPLLRRAAEYLNLALETGEISDPPEKNERWPVGVRLFAAATLAQIQPESPALDTVWDLWADIAGRTFVSGAYDRQAEIRAHQDLNGITIKNCYLSLPSRYHLALLGARAAALPPDIERALVRWVWTRTGGIGYLGEAVGVPPCMKAGPLDRWFMSIELLTRFPSWREQASDIVRWLWTQQKPDGFWDFGPRSPLSSVLPFAASWRKHPARAIDWTTRVLVVLARYYDP
jgi:hypothetical protein